MTVNPYQRINNNSVCSFRNNFAADTFELSYKQKRNDNMNLTPEIIKMLDCSDKKLVNEYLEQFIDYETMILSANDEEDVVSAMQHIADAAETETDSEILSKYIQVLHKAVYPNTGVGKYINCINIGQNKMLSDADKLLLDDIISSKQRN